jgi:hypothetical protein
VNRVPVEQEPQHLIVARVCGGVRCRPPRHHSQVDHGTIVEQPCDDDVVVSVTGAGVNQYRPSWKGGRIYGNV